MHDNNSLITEELYDETIIIYHKNYLSGAISEELYDASCLCLRGLLDPSLIEDTEEDAALMDNMLNIIYNAYKDIPQLREKFEISLDNMLPDIDLELRAEVINILDTKLKEDER